MADETTTIPLIRTKLQRPPIVGDHVHRSQLLKRLDQRLQRPLTLVTAPAGYGKSTLVSCWLETCDLPADWLSLDETDNDPTDCRANQSRRYFSQLSLLSKKSL